MKREYIDKLIARSATLDHMINSLHKSWENGIGDKEATKYIKQLKRELKLVSYAINCRRDAEAFEHHSKKMEDERDSLAAQLEKLQVPRDIEINPHTGKVEERCERERNVHQFTAMAGKDERERNVHQFTAMAGKDEREIICRAAFMDLKLQDKHKGV